MESKIGSFRYHNDPDATAGVHRGKAFTIGDIGYLDDEGYLFICDRAREIIISGGVNIYPAEVEAVLTGNPAVADVAVIGVPDDEWGEQVKAVVELVEGNEPTPELAAEIVAYCREHLAGYKCPRSVDFADTLPRTDTGKLFKRRIRDPYWEDAGRTV
jgi:long-chain acyl-CoA synthetase